VTILTYLLNSTYNIACYDANNDTIQFPINILNSLDTNRDFSTELMFVYAREMEKINSGDLTNINMVKLDTAIGSLGIDGITSKIERIVNGFC